jgi:hypothetical protein
LCLPGITSAIVAQPTHGRLESKSDGDGELAVADDGRGVPVGSLSAGVG